MNKLYFFFILIFLFFSCKKSPADTPIEELGPIDNPELYEVDEPEDSYNYESKELEIRTEDSQSAFEKFKQENFIDAKDKSIEFTENNYVKVFNGYYYKPVEEDMMLRVFIVNNGNVYFVKVMNSLVLLSYSDLHDTQIIYNVKGHVNDAAYFSKKIEIDAKTTQYLLDRERPMPGKVAKNGKCVFITSELAEIVEKNDQQFAKTKEGLTLLNAYLNSHEDEVDQDVVIDLFKKAINN